MNRVSNAQEISGHGVRAEIDGHTVLAGNSKLMKEMNVAYQECMSMGTVVYVAMDGIYCGYIVIADSIKDEAFEAIKNLKKVGVRRTIMLTGDKKEVGEAVAARLGLDEVHAELLPGDKVAKVEELLARQTGNTGWPLWETESMTRLFSPGLMWELPWEAWVQTQPSRQRILCLWTITLPESQMWSAYHERPCPL